MTDEDKVAAKLKGYNCLVKFVDGEELLFRVEALASQDVERPKKWFTDAEKFLNGSEEILPIRGVAVNRSSIKYIIDL